MNYLGALLEGYLTFKKITCRPQRRAQEEFYYGFIYKENN